MSIAQKEPDTRLQRQWTCVEPLIPFAGDLTVHAGPDAATDAQHKAEEKAINRGRNSDEVHRTICRDLESIRVTPSPLSQVAP